MDESKKHLSVRTSPTLASLANPECVPAPDTIPVPDGWLERGIEPDDVTSLMKLCRPVSQSSSLSRSREVRSTVLLSVQFIKIIRNIRE